jgi:hypothetical protein
VQLFHRPGFDELGLCLHFGRPQPGNAGVIPHDDSGRNYRTGDDARTSLHSGAWRDSVVPSSRSDGPVRAPSGALSYHLGALLAAVPSERARANVRL